MSIKAFYYDSEIFNYIFISYMFCITVLLYNYASWSMSWFSGTRCEFWRNMCWCNLLIPFLSLYGPNLHSRYTGLFTNKRIANNETPIKKSFQMVKKDKRVRKSNKGKKSKKNKRYNKSRKSKKNKRYAKLTNSVRNKRKKIKKRNDKSRRKNTKWLY